MVDVFISYKRTERAQCARIAELLQSEGFDVWFDAELEGGAHFPDVLNAKVSAAKAVLVLWSPAAAGSQWVRAEASVGLEAGKLVAATLEPVALPVPFNNVHAVDLAKWSGDPEAREWRQLQRPLRRLVRNETEDLGLPPATTGKAPRRNRRWALASGLGIAGAAAAGGAWLWSQQRHPLRPFATGELERLEFLRETAPLPARPVRDAQGASHDLADLLGQATLLNVWATWSAPCREELPTLADVASRFAERGLKVLAVSVDDDLTAAQATLNAIAPNLAFYSGHISMVQELRAAGIPSTIVYDRYGIETARVSGYTIWNGPDGVAFLSEVLKERPGLSENHTSG
jgi:thiol-disulfide isomerase/thioredoxin